MLAYIVRRTAYGVLVVLGDLFFLFALFFLLTSLFFLTFLALLLSLILASLFLLLATLFFFSSSLFLFSASIALTAAACCVFNSSKFDPVFKTDCVKLSSWPGNSRSSSSALPVIERGVVRAWL